MKKLHLLTFTVLLTIILTGCSGGFYPILFGEEKVNERAENFFSDESILSPQEALGSHTGAYSFVIFSDIHVGAAYEDSSEARNYRSSFLKKFTELYEQDDTIKPRFVICMGDSANDGYEHQYKKYTSYCESIRSIGNEKLGIENFKIYTAIGNHDLFHNGYRYWEKHIFPNHTFYGFKAGGFSYYVLDTANGTMGISQLKAIENELKKDSDPKIVITHYPLYGAGKIVLETQDTLLSGRLMNVCGENNVKQIFGGHTHKAEEKNYGKLTETVVASFLYDRTATLVTVDPATQTVTRTNFNF